MEKTERKMAQEPIRRLERELGQLRARDYREWSGSGVVFSAELFNENGHVGSIENNGRGGMTMYHLDTRELRDEFEAAALARYPEFSTTIATDQYIEDILQESGF